MRVAAVLVIAAVVAFQIVRTAAVADRNQRLALAATLWQSHPAVLTDRSLLTIASAAARSQEVPAATRADLRRVAVRAPLSPDPFLIEGAIATMAGDGRKAERLLIEARNRDPRSRGTRYLLAERFFRTGRVTDALIEMQALVSLHERGGEPFVPALVAYAQTPGAIPQLKAFFRKFPRVEAAVLTSLAGDAANADLVLALAAARNPDPDWRGTLIFALASAGQYHKAHVLWVRFTDGARGQGLFNQSFESVLAPAPFNWTFPASSEGVAEPRGGHSLDILYYGRANAVLATQLLVLPQGRYRLSMNVADASREADAIHWIVRCAQGNGILADLPLRVGTTAVAFEVPPTCPAQWLELQGFAGDLPRTTELTISAIGLNREQAR